MSDQPIVFEEWKTADGELIAVARLNTPRNLNSLSMDMISLLKPQLSRWAEDPKVQAVWLEAEGDKAFCAGGDIVSLYRAMTEPGKLAEGERFFEWNLGPATVEVDDAVFVDAWRAFYKALGRPND